MDSSRILGVGLGVFFIALLWFITLFSSIVLYRIRPTLPLILTGLAAVLTAVILAIPKVAKKDLLYSSNSSNSSPIFKVKSNQQICSVSIQSLVLTFFSWLGDWCDIWNKSGDLRYFKSRNLCWTCPHILFGNCSTKAILIYRISAHHTATTSQLKSRIIFLC